MKSRLTGSEMSAATRVLALLVAIVAMCYCVRPRQPPTCSSPSPILTVAAITRINNAPGNFPNQNNQNIDTLTFEIENSGVAPCHACDGRVTVSVTGPADVKLVQNVFNIPYLAAGEKHNLVINAFILGDVTPANLIKTAVFNVTLNVVYRDNLGTPVQVTPLPCFRSVDSVPPTPFTPC